METKRWIIAGLLFGILWVFVSGPAMTPVTVLGSFILGIAVGMPVAFVFRRLYAEQFRLSRIGALYYILLYAVVFTKEILVANLDVAYRVLSPGMPLEPQVILIPLRVETAFGITTIANSITITPGTMTLDYDPDHNALYVHVINGRHPEDIVEPIRQWEDYTLQIFDEEKSPDDEPIGIFVHPPGYPPEPKTAPPEDFEERISGEQESTEETDGR